MVIKQSIYMREIAQTRNRACMNEYRIGLMAEFEAPSHWAMGTRMSKMGGRAALVNLMVQKMMYSGSHMPANVTTTTRIIIVAWMCMPEDLINNSKCIDAAPHSPCSGFSPHVRGAGSVCQAPSDSRRGTK